MIAKVIFHDNFTIISLMDRPVILTSRHELKLGILLRCQNNWSILMTNLQIIFLKAFTVLYNFCLSCMFQWLEVHPIVDITFHPSSNLTVNSRKRSSQFEWYDITRYDITLIKTGRPAVTEPDGMTIKLDDLC